MAAMAHSRSIMSDAELLSIQYQTLFVTTASGRIQRENDPDQSPGPEVHQMHPGRDLIEKGTFRHREYQVHRHTALAQALQQVQDYPLGSPTPDRAKEEGDGMPAVDGHGSRFPDHFKLVPS